MPRSRVFPCGKRVRRGLVRALFPLTATLACAPAGSLPSRETRALRPLPAPADAVGRLEIRVTGKPRDIVYRINGHEVEPARPIAWWRDAALDLELRAGYYDLQAEYVALTHAGRLAPFRIVARRPIEVRPGRTTRVTAALERDARGVPRRRVATFQVQVPEPPPRVDTVIAPRSPANRAPAARVARGTARVAAGSLQDPAGTVRSPAAGAERPPALGATPPPPRAAATAPAAVVVPNTPGLPSSAPPAFEELPPPPVAGDDSLPLLELAPGADLRVTLTVRSVPAGVRLRVDDREVGSTPVRVRLDPRRDHVLRFEPAGAPPWIRVLAAREWQRGRPAVLEVRLPIEPRSAPPTAPAASDAEGVPPRPSPGLPVPRP